MIILDSMGHLYSTESLKELYDFAVNKLGLKPEWNHYSGNLPHFDLTTKRKQNQAVALGAKYMEARGAIGEVKKARKLYKKFYDENHDKKYWYESTGLYKQKILRIDFKKLGIE